MESDLTPEQLEIAAEVHRVSVEEMAEFMRPADAPGRMLPPSVIRDMQQSIRDDVQRREWWEKLAGGARVHGKLGAGDVRPPVLCARPGPPVFIAPAGTDDFVEAPLAPAFPVFHEPWHHRQLVLGGEDLSRKIAELDQRNLERVAAEAVFRVAAQDEALEDISAASGVSIPVARAAMDDLSRALQGSLVDSFTQSLIDQEARDVAEHRRVADLQKIAPNRAERRRLAREERRRGRLG